MTSYFVFIKGYRIDLDAYCEHHTIPVPTHPNFLRTLSFNDEPAPVIMVQRAYDSGDVDDFPFYVAFDVFDTKNNAKALSVDERVALRTVSSTSILDNVEMKPYYIASPSGIFCDFYDCNRGLSTVSRPLQQLSKRRRVKKK